MRERFLITHTAISRLRHAEPLVGFWRRYHYSNRSIHPARLRQALARRLAILKSAVDGYKLGGIICLPQNTQLSSSPLQIEFEFKIHGQGNLYGDGFAMWITKERAAPGNVFGCADKFEGLGIFFDTYKNNRPGTVFPYIMAMNGDGQTAYDKDNDGKANEIAGCSVRYSFILVLTNPSNVFH